MLNVVLILNLQTGLVLMVMARMGGEEVDEEQLRTLWCGGIGEKVTEEVLYELFLNAGPLERVTIPKDRETKKPKNFGFIVYEHEESVKFAFDLFNGTELHRGRIRLQNKTTGLGMGREAGGGPPRLAHQRWARLTLT